MPKIDCSEIESALLLQVEHANRLGAAESDRLDAEADRLKAESDRLRAAAAKLDETRQTETARAIALVAKAHGWEPPRSAAAKIEKAGEGLLCVSWPDEEPTPADYARAAVKILPGGCDPELVDEAPSAGAPEALP